MGQQIIKQPNGRYCIFSSIVDTVTYYDLDRDELVQAMLEREKGMIEVSVDHVLEKLAAGKKPYYQFTMGFEEMLGTVAEVHDQPEADRVRKLMEVNSGE